MPIIASQPPVEAHAAVHDAVASRAARAAFAPSNLRRANPHALSIALPHRVAYLPAERVDPNLKPEDAPQFLKENPRFFRDNAQIRHWRFLIHEKRYEALETGTKAAKHFPIAAATLALTEGGNYLLRDLNEGFLVVETEKAIRFAERKAEVDKFDFEAFLFVVPGFYTAALWLQETDPVRDIIVSLPVDPTARDETTPGDFLKFLLNQQSRNRSV